MFRDAQEYHRLSPQTFEVPSAERLARVGPGSVVKICAAFPETAEEIDAERFWVEVLERDGDRLIGRVDNDLHHTQHHGLALHDRVEFSVTNIYDVYD